jgi:hypothetical protein
MPFGTVKSVANAEGQQMDEGHDGDASDNDDDVGETKIVPGAHLIFVVFDIIYLDGPGAFDVVKAALDKHPIGNFTEEKVGSICHVPLLLRRDILSKVCNWVDTRFIMVQVRAPRPCQYVRDDATFLTSSFRVFRTRTHRTAVGSPAL